LRFDCVEFRALLGVCAFVSVSASSCSSSNFETVQRVVSPDGNYWVEVDVNRGSALKPDWYFAEIGATHPTGTDTLRGGSSEDLASLQSRGQLSVFWSAPREVTVVCSACDTRAFRTGSQSWQGIKVRYATYY
jgi:hypothetical protein